MATEIAERRALASVSAPTTPSLSAWLISAASSVSRIEDAGKTIWKLPANYRLSASEIAEAQEIGEEIAVALTPTREGLQPALEAIGKLLFAYAIGQTTEQAAKGRAAVYLDVVKDLPGWAIKQAVDKWLRHEAGEYDYHWLPMPPEFRVIVLQQTAALRFEQLRIERLLSACGAEASAKPSEEERRRVIDGFRNLSDILGKPTRQQQEAAE